MLRSACLCLSMAAILLAEEAQTRLYDTSFLTTLIPDWRGDDLGPVPIDRTPSGWQPFSNDQLRELIKREVAPDRWDAESDLSVMEGAISVKAPADVQEAVARLLSRLAASIGPQVLVQVRRFRVSSDLLARLSPAGTLDDARRKALDEAIATKSDAALAGEARVTAFSGQRVHVKDATAMSYVRDYDGMIAEGSAIADPVPSQVQEGTLVDVRPFLSPDGASVAIECRLRSAAIVSIDEFSSGTQELGVLQLPEVDTTSLLTNVVVPEGGTALAGVVLLPPERRDGKLRYECVLVHAARLGPAPEAPPRDGSKPIRVIDAGYVVHAFPDFPGPELSLPSPLSGGSEGATFAVAGEDALAVPGDFVTFLLDRVAPGTWTADHLLEPASAGRILAKNTPDAMAKLDAYLEDLAWLRGTTVSVELRFLALSPDAASGLPSPGATPTEAQARALLARAESGDAVRELGTAIACGMVGRRFSLAVVRQKACVQDYDVEVATKAKIGDPVVGTLSTGVVLDALAQVQTGGGRLLLDLRPTYAEPGGPLEPLELGSGDLGKLHVPSIRCLETRSSLLLESGAWSVVGLGTGRDGEAILTLARATLSSE